MILSLSMTGGTGDKVIAIVVMAGDVVMAGGAGTVINVPRLHAIAMRLAARDDTEMTESESSPCGLQPHRKRACSQR